MYSYSEKLAKIKDQIGETPKAVVGYYGYANGVVIGTFESSKAAKDAGATMVETTTKNKAEIDAYKEKYKEAYTALQERFLKDLRSEYDYLNDNLYNVIYARAYEDSHAYGFDEVASKLDDFVDFARDIIAASK